MLSVSSFSAWYTHYISKVSSNTWIIWLHCTSLVSTPSAVTPCMHMVQRKSNSRCNIWCQRSIPCVWSVQSSEWSGQPVLFSLLISKSCWASACHTEEMYTVLMIITDDVYNPVALSSEMNNRSRPSCKEYAYWIHVLKKRRCRPLHTYPVDYTFVWPVIKFQPN